MTDPRSALLAHAVLCRESTSRIRPVYAGPGLRSANLAGLDLSRANLVGSWLVNADLSGSLLTKAYAAEARFDRACLQETDCRGASFRRTSLRSANFRGADLRGADLRGANARNARFEFANLSGVDLTLTVLVDAELSGACLFGAKLPSNTPVVPDIHRAIANAISAEGCKLDMGRWHGAGACQTTHCRAGWAIHLAGESGYDLEAELGSDAAAALIYQASDPSLSRIPTWYEDTRVAAEDIQRMAQAAQPSV